MASDGARSLSNLTSKQGLAAPLRCTQRRGVRAREKLAAWSVTPPQYALLKVLWDRDGQSGAAIGSRLVIDSATITGVIDRLEEAGLLERRADDGDRRVHRLFLTARGQGLQEPLDAAMDQLNAEVRVELKGQARALWDGLRRLGEAGT
ncbi:MAG TPA: MarR family transcriptional regulator [Steroidobacteraceae bacterium]|nr:MarR family transcriptional regulator [Steroidobacteraceae bacterium]